jgi:uncharacterized membrane protein
MFERWTLPAKTTAAGFIIGLLWVTVGFWQMLWVIILTLIGWTLGTYYPEIKQLLKQ